jgi:hypothetical protein
MQSPSAGWTSTSKIATKIALEDLIALISSRWHGSRLVYSAFLAAVYHVINLSTRKRDADLHQLATSGALRRMGRKARLGLSWALTIFTSRPLMRL